MGEVIEDWKGADISSVFKKGEKKDWRNYGPVNLRSISEEVMEVLLETISKHVKDRKVFRNSQDGFTQGESCLTNLLAFYNEVTTLIDKVYVLS